MDNKNDLTKIKLGHDIDSENFIDDGILGNLPVTLNALQPPNDTSVEITINELNGAASGSFGTVFEGYLSNDVHIALKKVLQDKRYKNREITILKTLDHRNVTTLLYYFYSKTENNDIYLYLMMTYMSQTLARILRFYCKNRSHLPSLYAKLYVYQLVRGINYLHQLSICHRDIKPQNILIEPTKFLLKICDFGSAKKLSPNETNIAYICSRYYRAPELIFGATNYTVLIDIWSAGCVMAEVFLNKPLFPGETTVDQMVEIFKILGSPSEDELRDMNPNYESIALPRIVACDLSSIFNNPAVTSDAIDLLKNTLMYSPERRYNAIDVMAHKYFDDLRNSDKKWKNDDISLIYDFSDIELQNATSSQVHKLKSEIVNS